MTGQLHERAASIGRMIHNHPQLGADMLMDFARQFASDPQLEDDVILLKVRLLETRSKADRRDIVMLLDQILVKITNGFDPGLIQANKEKEQLLLEALRKQEPANNQVLIAQDIYKHFISSDFTLRLKYLELRLGQITGVVGENATGKTTLFRILSGDLVADSGTLSYPLFDLENKHAWLQIKAKIAYVPQDLPRWYGPLRDNLAYEAALHGIKGDENKKAVDYIVQRLGLSLHLDKDWSELSGGFQLRFALAKALVWKAQLLIIDEPLAHLDIKTQFIVLNDIQNLAKSLSHPMAVLISSQHLHETEAVADQMIFMQDGQLENLGNTAEFGSTRIRNLFEIGCNASYRDLQFWLDNFPHLKIWNNGMYWVIATPLTVSGIDLLQHLDSKGVVVNYFRDLSHSVKTKFYESNL